MVSQDSKISNSINWDYEHPIAIQGSFENGKLKLLDFLNNHQLQNIISECGEIYEMGDGEIEDQNKNLYEEDILKIESQENEYFNDFKIMNTNIKKLKKEISDLSKPKGFLSKLFSSDNSTKIKELEKKVKNTEQEMWNMLGINYWSDFLYFHFENE